MATSMEVVLADPKMKAVRSELGFFQWVLRLPSLAKEWKDGDGHMAINFRDLMEGRPQEDNNWRYSFYCGYVNTKLKVDEDQVECHGGVTLCEAEPDGTYTYGFDCGHVWDENDPKLRDINFLTDECERMLVSIVQLAREQDKK